MKVSASPALISDGDHVTVSFTGYTGSADAWIAAYSPPPSDITSVAPVEWFVSGKSAAGNYSFRLVNMRASYAFVLFSGGLDKPVAIAQSNAVAFYNDNQPRAPRLAQLDARTMQLTWTSAVSSGSPRVTVTNSATGASTTYDATSNTWNASSLCGAPATTVGYRDPGMHHTATMNGLQPGQAYSYVFGDDSEMSAPFTFIHPRGAYPFGVAAYGDEGALNSDSSTIVQDFPPAPNTSSLVGAWIDAAGPGVVQAVHHIGGAWGRLLLRLLSARDASVGPVMGISPVSDPVLTHSIPVLQTSRTLAGTRPTGTSLPT